jgi:hypothetical protein
VRPSPPAGGGGGARGRDSRRPIRRARRRHTFADALVVRLAKRLRRASPKTGKRRSLREISAELAAATSTVQA